MSRPPKEPSDLKTERVVLVISKADLEAIDEWGWSNHIRSRSEVIRRLCQLGMESGRFKASEENHKGLGAAYLKMVEG